MNRAKSERVRDRATGAGRSEQFGLDLNLENDTDARTRSITLVGQGRRVLELAAPTKPMERVARALMTHKACHVVAVEKDGAVCAVLRKYCTAVVHGDIQQVNLTPYLHGRRFDVALLGSLLEHVPDPTVVLQKLRPYLADDGVIVATLTNLNHGSVRLAALGGETDVPADALHRYTLRQIERVLLRVGFGVDAVERMKLDPYLDPRTMQPAWDAQSVPAAVRLLLQRDPEAEVACYVLRASKLTAAAAEARLVALDAAQAETGGPRAMLDPQDLDQLEQTERAAVRAREEAERRADQLTLELEQMRRQLEERDGQLQQLSESLDQEREAHNGALLDVLGRTEVLEQGLFARERELTGAHDDLAQRDGRIERLEQQLSEARDQLESGRAASDGWIANLEADLAAREKDLAGSTERVEELERQLEERTDQANTLKAQLEAVRAVAEEADSRVELLEATLSARDGELGQMAERLASLQRQLEERGAELTESRSEAQAALGRVEDLSQTLDRREQKLADLSHRASQQEVRLEQQATELARLHDELSASQERASDQQQRLAAAEGELAAVTDRASELDRTLTVTRQEAEQGRIAAEELQATVALRERELVEAAERVAEQDRQLSWQVTEQASLDARLGELTAALSQRDTELAGTVQRVVEQEQLIARRTEQLLESEEQLDECRHVARQAHGQVAELEQSLLLGQQELEQAARQVVEREEQLAQQAEQELALAADLEHARQERQRDQEQARREQQLAQEQAALQVAELSRLLDGRREELEEAAWNTARLDSQLERQASHQLELQTQLDLSRAAEEEQRACVVGLERDAETLAQDRLELQQLIARQQEQLEQVGQELDQLGQERERLEQELTARDAQLRRQQQELESSQTAARDAGARWVSRVTELEHEMEQRGQLLGEQESRLLRLVQALNAARENEVKVSELTRSVQGKERTISELQQKLERIRQERAELTRQLGSTAEQYKRELEDRAQRIVVQDQELQRLRRDLEQAERLAGGLRMGLEINAARMEQELDSMRGHVVWRLLGQYDRAAQLLLPAGSRRRAVLEKVLGPAWREPAGRDVQRPVQTLLRRRPTTLITSAPTTARIVTDERSTERSGSM